MKLYKRVKPSVIRDQNDNTGKQINDSKMLWPLNNRGERKTERVKHYDFNDPMRNIYTKRGGNTKTENTVKCHDDVVFSGRL